MKRVMLRVCGVVAVIWTVLAGQAMASELAGSLPVVKAHQYRFSHKGATGAPAPHVFPAALSPRLTGPALRGAPEGIANYSKTTFGNFVQDIIYGKDGFIYASVQKNNEVGLGSADGVAKFDTSLQLLKSNLTAVVNLNHYAITTDRDNNVIVSGDTTYGLTGMVVVKYNSDLVFIASTTFSLDNSGSGYDVVADEAGNIYVGGTVYYNGAYRIWLAKYSPSLGLISTTVLSKSPVGGITGLKLASDDTLYATGYVYEIDGAGNMIDNSNIWLAKYDTSLSLLKETTTDLTKEDYPGGLEITPQGRIFVAGSIGETKDSEETDVWVAEYDSSLNLKNSATLKVSNARPESLDSWYSLVYAEGTLFLAGTVDYLEGYSFQNKRYESQGGMLVAQYDQNLVLVSSLTITGENGYDSGDEGDAVVYDGRGSIYVGGWIKDCSSSACGTATGWLSKHPVPQPTVASDGGNISLFSTFGEVKVDVPLGAFSQEVRFTMTAPTSLPEAASPTHRLLSNGVAVQINVEGNTQPQKDVSLTLSYRDADVAGLDESKLALARYDETRGFWVVLPSSVDVTNNQVTGRTDHFSLFQIVQLAPYPTVDTVKAYPNPLRPGLPGHTAIIFTGLPANAKIRLHTFSGELVGERLADSVGTASWNGKNDSGEEVASGVYLVFVEGVGGEATLKVMVQK